MYTRQIIIFIISVNFFVFGFIHTDADDTITIPEFEGVWYVMSLITPNPDLFRNVRCFQMIIRKTYDDNFFIDANLITNGTANGYSGYGDIKNSEIQYHTRHEEAWIGTVSKFTWGKELIFHDKVHTNHYQLLSRLPTVVMSTKREFEKRAAMVNLTVTDVCHSICSYKMN